MRRNMMKMGPSLMEIRRKPVLTLNKGLGPYRSKGLIHALHCNLI
jgi:hypothetical protein